MKKYIVFAVIIASAFSATSQTLNDAGRVVLNAVVLDPSNIIPDEAEAQLVNKLNQIATAQGISGTSLTPRFIIAAKINVLSKDIIAGPPQMVALNTEIVFFIGDAIANKIFANTSISNKGVGINENKAMISAIQNINIKNNLFATLTEKGKNEIAGYYNAQCKIVQQKAKGLEGQQKYDAAIFELMQIPDVCKDCYTESMNAIKPIYKKMIDNQGKAGLIEAKAKWASQPNEAGASDAGKIIANIDPESTSYAEAQQLTEVIRKKIMADQKKEWDFKLKNLEANENIEKARITSAQKVAIAYYQNQPKTIIYNRIIW